MELPWLLEAMEGGLDLNDEGSGGSANSAPAVKRFKDKSSQHEEPDDKELSFDDVVALLAGLAGTSVFSCEVDTAPT